MRRREADEAPVWLLGSEKQVRAATRAAVRVCAAKGGLPETFVSDLVLLHGRRQRLWSLSPTHALGETLPPAGSVAAVRSLRVWWLMVAVLAAAPTAATLVLLVAGEEPGVVPLTLATVLLGIAAAAGAQLLLETPTTGRGVPRSRAENAVAVLALGAVASGILGLTAAFSEDSGAPGWWFVLVVAVLVLTVVLCARLTAAARRRPRRTAAERAEARDADARRLAAETLRQAHRLAGLPRDATIRQGAAMAWGAELRTMARYLPEDVLEQAASLSPVEWMVWSAYDGRLELRPAILAPLRRGR